MNIQIILSDAPDTRATFSVAFHVEEWMRPLIGTAKTIQGTVIIDGTPCDFVFSPYSLDGNIFCNDPSHRLIIKQLVPTLVYNSMR